MSTVDNEINGAKEKMAERAANLGSAMGEAASEVKKAVKDLGSVKDTLLKEIKSEFQNGMRMARENGKDLMNRRPGETLLGVFLGGLVLGALLFSRNKS